MQRANVSTLRANLSKLLRAAKRGETVEIIERDTPIALLVPVSSVTRNSTAELPAWAERLRRKGGARFGDLKKVDLSKIHPPTSDRDLGGVRAIVDERRDGR
jgi:prevent-host-death family protein